MIKIKLSLFHLALMAAFIACTPIYTPNVHNMPLHSNKGDVSAGLHVGGSGYDGQLSYAVTNHVAIMANGMYQRRNTDDDSLPDFYERFLGEAGAGYFTKVGKAGRFEAYGGMGTGYGWAEVNYWWFGAQGNSVKGYYNRLFLQTTFGAVSEYFDGGLSLRGTYLNFYKYSSDGTTFHNSFDEYFIEPVMFSRIGWKYIKFQTEFGFNIHLGNSKFDDFSPFIFNMGLIFNINALGKNWWDQ